MKCSRISTTWFVSLLAAIGAAAAAAGPQPVLSGENGVPAILREAGAFLRESALKNGLSLRTVSVEAPESYEPPAGPAAYKFRLARPVSTGRLALTAIVEENGRPVRALLMSAEVVAQAEVFVAARDLPVGKVIGPADYRTETKELPEGLEPKEVRVRPLGQAARTAIAAGSVLTASVLAQPREVVRGEMVTLIAEGRGYTVRLLARAGRDGAHGERIPVVNLASGQTIIADVAGRGVVRVGPPADPEGGYRP